jgi:ParB-like chromosome segregation protein Spo0J
MSELRFHTLANVFPLMEGEEFDALVADIKANGLREPITIFEGKILDGRNRYRACLKAGIEVKTEPFEGTEADARAFVISKNIHRRHLTAERKRALIAELVKAQPEKSDRQIAKTAKVDHKTVAVVRSEIEGRGEIPHVETRTDTKGRKQPARKQPSRKPTQRKPTKRKLEQEEWDRRVREEYDQVVAILIERLGRDGFVLVAAAGFACGVGLAFEASLRRHLKDGELDEDYCDREYFIAKFGKQAKASAAVPRESAVENAPPPDVGADNMRAQIAALDDGRAP